MSKCRTKTALPEWSLFFFTQERTMTTGTSLDLYTQATTGVAEGLLQRWLPVTIAYFMQILHPWAYAETWAIFGSIVCLIAIIKSNWYWAAYSICTTISLLCLTVPHLHTINVEYWGALSAMCLVGIVAAQHLRSPAHRVFELQILHNKLPYPRLMLGSILMPVVLNNVTWTAAGANTDTWLAAHVFAVIITLMLGAYYAWTYSE